MTKFEILTIFPEIFTEVFSTSILKRAQEKKLIQIRIHNLRDYTLDKHKTVDEKPFGGGPGMLMKVEPVYRALQKLTSNFKKDPKRKIILLDPRGKKLDQKFLVAEAKKIQQFILICPRYEGIDERILKFVDKSISIGDYVLSGAELPAMVFVDGITRLIPGVLGKTESLLDETFKEKNYKKYPQYTQPREFENMKVPEILLSGNHKKIVEWQKNKN